MKNIRLLDCMTERVLLFDGAMGTSIHAHKLPLSDYRELENCCEVLNLTRPDVIAAIHRSFFDVGCDAVETNTFSGSRLVLAEFGLQDQTREINRRAAEIARGVADDFSRADRPRFVIGSVGPGTKLPSLRQATFDQLLESYTQQGLGLLEGSVDAILIETCQDLLQVKAAINAMRDAMSELDYEVPLLVTVTMETTGTMLVGADVAAAVATIDAFADVCGLGLNCATGPQEMSEHVRYLSSCSARPIIVQPNAGLPQLVDGEPHYMLTPEEFTRWLIEFVEVDGVSAVGGCCGTTPAHLAALAEKLGARRPRERNVRFEPAVSSLYQAVPIRQDNSILIVGERTNANGSKKFREYLQAENVDGMVQMAKAVVKEGSHLIDVCVAYVGRDEVADAERVISRYATEVSVPLMIDSTEAPVLEAALKLAGGKCVINSINLEDGEERMERVCALARRYGAALVALTIEESGMAKTAERKLAVARRIYDLATKRYGIPPHDLIFDPLTFTICTGNEDDRRLAMETLEGIRLIKQHLPGVHTMLGLSNVSFGLNPEARAILNSVFLHYAREAGLDAAILHMAKITPMYKIDEPQREAARRLIFDARDEVADPLLAFIALFPEEKAGAPREQRHAATAEERLKNRIVDGDRQGLEGDLEEALATHKPLDIINNILLDGMKVVGELFGAGQMQLPFVLQSAETMKAAVAYLEPRMERVSGEAKGKLVLATVRGDVHDIGKNLVDIILTNNGYQVYNLGIKQPLASILDAHEQHGANAIGMSGLLVKSTVVMKENLEVMNERGLRVPVILGGAALTRKYVEQDLRAVYDGPLFYAKDAFEGLRLMNAVMAGEAEPDAEVEELLAAERPRRVARTLEERQGEAPATAVVQRSSISTTVPVPQPPFWGARVIERIPLRAVLGYLNEVMLFQLQWQYKKAGRPAADFKHFIDAEVRPLYRDLVSQCEREEILRPQAIYGFWPAQADGNELVVYSPEDHRTELTRFRFPRQPADPFWCLADFFRPAETGEMDVVAFSIVTVGQQASDTARHWFEQNRYRDYLHLHGLGVETAEALAEYIHKQVRLDLGIADEDERDLRKLLQQGYRGCRYSWGYPACPDLEEQARLWPLLSPERIGVSLSEEYQLHPEQSTSALICHHPDARYFKA